ncbi:uncharacterized protein LTR77_002561 [Saxophila tyrrhenica]|uniref:AB hydrolase-1 domain-containing protein n=1 Tax=Saxophila tyrrhenica TaxID=1690608 RepID=A0AAV9PME2_9PEZI|nr:hypothetical protein LTR77_002561 [Saxophila tyrrhenica]
MIEMRDDTNMEASSSARRPPALPPRQSSSGAPLSPYTEPPPSYDTIAASDAMSKGPWSTQDQRTSSTQSLVPSESNEQKERRRLLLIYIHGFMGNETSFRSFPAHVHHLLTVLLAETHVVHTKIYPRYRSKRNITFARDDFSKWLEPHESPTTDVVLLGHSMGGLLSAEIALMPAPPPANRPFKHRILGTINFDVPFLGMHPGVVKSGLASMFISGEAPGDKWTPEMGALQNDGASTASGAMSPISPMSTRTDTLWQPAQSDHNYNPSFDNDVVLPMRKGWQNALHFVNKHSGHVLKATKQLVTSHMEFGGAMANYPELKARYGRIRALEAEDGNVRKSIAKSTQTPARVRFVNYYTASTGRPKKPKTPERKSSPGSNASRTSLTPSMAVEGRGRQDGAGVPSSRSPSPRISLEEHSDDGVVKKVPEIPGSEDESWQEAAESLTIDNGKNAEYHDAPDPPALSPSSTISTTASWPTIPPQPTAPPPLNVSYIQDPATRKLVEKEHTRAVKAYEKAVKDRERAIRDRAKLEEKRGRKERKDSERSIKNSQKAEQKALAAALKVEQQQQKKKPTTQKQGEELRLEQERQRMEAEGRRLRGEPDPPPEQDSQEAVDDPPMMPIHDHEIIHENDAPQMQRLPSTSPVRSPSPSPSPHQSPDPVTRSTTNTTTTAAAAADTGSAQKSDRKFCTLPPKDASGERDPLWVRIFMENVDEVGAHCGLFFVDERYERLVGEVADRVEGWVREESALVERHGEEDWQLD